MQGLETAGRRCKMNGCKMDRFKEEEEVWFREKLGRTVLTAQLRVLLAGALLLMAGFFMGLLAGYSVASSLFVSEGDSPSGASQEPDWGGNVVISGKTVPVLQWLDSELKPANIRENLKELTKKPHIAGNVSDAAVAMLIYNRWKNYQFDSLELTNYTVLLQYPGNFTRPNRLQLRSSSGAVIYNASIQQEKPLTPGENDSSVAPPYNAFSGSGNVTGPLVYVNFGRLEDFLYLNRTLKLSLDGHICIARYGEIFRGNKAFLAQHYRCVALLIYSDPAEYAPKGGPPVYPNGTSLPPSGIQRGSLLINNGHPLTPGVPAIPGITRRSYEAVEEEGAVPKIPVQPISYGEAIHFMSQLSQYPVPAGWTGQLNLSAYYILQSPTNTNKTYLEVNNYLINKTITNVIATIYGSVEPDRYVMLGNHHDAWVFGAVDPNSGTATLMELARALNDLRSNNWRPGRTLILCSWDAEEFGLMGSTELVEEYSKLIGANAVTYLNVDSAVDGTYYFSAGASPLLSQILYNATKMTKCPNPQFNTVYDEWLYYMPDPSKTRPEIPGLGSGSDFTPFLQLLGVTCSSMSYISKNPTGYPVYHSVHDNFYYEANLTDPTFAYHTAIGLVWGKAAMLVATSPVVPFDPRDYSTALSSILSNLEKEYGADLKRENISLNYLSSSIAQFSVSANQLWAELQAATGEPSDLTTVRMLNYRLMQLERAFIIPEGLPGRPFYKHVVYAPSSINEYGSSLFPGVSDAIFNALNFGASWFEVRRQIDLVRVHILYASDIMRQRYGQH